MTTYQDPPLSRRAVREQKERDQAQSAVVPTTGPTPTPVAPPAPAEPLTYATQARTPVPGYDSPALRTRRTPAPAETSSDPGAFRPRDFSPEGRRSAAPEWAPQYGGAAPAPEQPPAPGPDSSFAPHPPAEPTVLPSALDTADQVEHTLTRRELRALRDAHGITAAPEESAPVSPGTPLAAPSTRLDSALAEFDQLAGRTEAPAAPADAAPPAPVRGRRAAPQPADALSTGDAPPALVTGDVPPALVTGDVPPALVTGDVPAALVTGDVPPALVTGDVPPAPVAEVPPAPVVAPVAEVPPLPPAAPVAPAPAAPAGPAQVAPEALAPVPLVEPPAAPVAVPQPQAAPEPEIVVAEIVDEPAAQPSAADQAPAASAEPSTNTPTGHWTTQAQLDDETQFGDQQLSRNIGATSGAITTSALVLPSIPNHDFGPIVTGDIMVTGSISLPPTMSATGAHPAQVDQSDLDHLLDPGDSQVSTGSQPVRAIKAVSTHTSSRGVIQTVKPKGTRGLTALIIAATSMAVVVGALFIVLVVTGQLG
jgi:hypothetical protein